MNTLEINNLLRSYILLAFEYRLFSEFHFLFIFLFIKSMPTDSQLDYIL